MQRAYPVCWFRCALTHPVLYRRDVAYHGQHVHHGDFGIVATPGAIGECEGESAVQRHDGVARLHLPQHHYPSIRDLIRVKFRFKLHQNLEAFHLAQGSEYCSAQVQPLRVALHHVLKHVGNRGSIRQSPMLEDVSFDLR